MPRFAALLATALLATSGCGESEEASTRAVTGSFVGEVSGSDAFVAIVAGKENVMAYVCNGGRGIARVFEGPRDGQRAELETDDPAASLSATLTAEGASGTVALPGRPPLEFAARRAAGDAGLYWIPRKRPVDAAWVVLNDGRQRGTLSGTKVDTSTSTATLRDSRTVTVAQVTPTRVSASGFGGFGQFSG